MSGVVRAALLVACALLAGCAIRPLPEDVAGVPTPVIVKQVRCETRQAAIDLALGWLTDERNLAEKRVDQRGYEIGVEFRNGRPIQQFEPKLFQGHARDVLNTFFGTGVAATFDLEMTEENNLGTEINLLQPFSSSNFTLGIKGKANRLRKNERVFTITDSFSGLLRLPDHYCSGASIGRDYTHLVGPNTIYPITGEIGVKGFIKDFINMTIFENLGGPKDKRDGPPTLVDALEFQTVISGSVAPKIAFSGVRSGLQVSNAALTGEATRTDLHKITMGLAVPGPGLPALAQLRSYQYLPLLSAKPSTAAEASAAEAVNQVLALKLFRPTIVVSP
ncbi:hypothetical protein HNR60_002925 [Rhodopseudomonas rhenobacensis]|uniref:Lipoprotein n=1 Tax=Rhodopseudomonas rhenobacensis TaxID=87461 RepID=A0A7W7Z5C6_9BRAD|nr:hypothetical protein [Rhodopseudomonas rhenobacensis]MBB5048163.1 hypothetical protein [Rhodopseudomonas rhenobacensis]